MEYPSYHWKRYWVPRDGEFAFDSQCFLLPLGKDAERARIWKTDVVAFDDLLTKLCLILLGEPGIGKTYALDHAVEYMTAVSLGMKPNILYRNLNSYCSGFLLMDGIFLSPGFKHGRTKVVNFTFF